MQKKVCITHGKGRLGNIMFTFATGMFFAKQTGREFYFFYDPEDIEHYNNYYERELNYGIFHQVNRVLQEEIFDKSKFDISNMEYLREVHATYTPLVDDPNIEVEFVDGWRLNPRYFTRDFAIEIFGPKQDILDYIRQLYPNIPFEDCVSINVRRGDYIQYKTWGYVTNEFPFYKRVFEDFPQDLKYVITSDDIDWCKEVFKGDNFYFIDKTPLKFLKMWVDLYIPGLCKHNIISNSTFSWWGAYLNPHKDRKVYYQYPFYKNERNDGYTYDCIIPDDENWIGIHQNDLTRVALCCFVKEENRYLREWVEYYKKLGIDHIFMYDNNDFTGEAIWANIGDYIIGGYISLADYRNRLADVTTGPSMQLIAYQDNYEHVGKDYDWICYFDVDEFLYLNDYDNIKLFLNYLSKFTAADIIVVNQMIYDDNGLVKYEDKPVLERFTHSAKARYNEDNRFVKSIVRGGLPREKICWTSANNTRNPLNYMDWPNTCREEIRQDFISKGMDPNRVHPNDFNRLWNEKINVCCDLAGNIISYFPLGEMDNFTRLQTLWPALFNIGCLKHFRYKTIEEYCKIKIPRSYPWIYNSPNSFKKFVIDRFFEYNEYTPEKEHLAQELLQYNFNDNEYPARSTNISICACVKNLNRYIREWIDWHHSLGFDHIYLYDCNSTDGERLEEVIYDYISSGYVSVVDFRGKNFNKYLTLQVIAFNDCYRRNDLKYKWLAYINVEDFIYINPDKCEANIHALLDLKKFDSYMCICLNTKFYDDYSLVRYEDKPVMERFKHPIDTKVLKNLIKSIVRSGYYNKANWLGANEPYLPLSPEKDEQLCCDVNALPCRFLDINDNFKEVKHYTLYTRPDFSFCYIKNYQFKTIEEYLQMRDSNSFMYNDYDRDNILGIDNYIDLFFKFNEMTEEKMKVIEEFKSQDKK